MLALIKKPAKETQKQETTYGYLKKFIGNMKDGELRDFLRLPQEFVITVEAISVTFNSSSVLAWCSTVSTCIPNLELPTTCMSFVEFSEEFFIILSEMSWSHNSEVARMDAI